MMAGLARVWTVHTVVQLVLVVLFLQYAYLIAQGRDFRQMSFYEAYDLGLVRCPKTAESSFQY